MKKIYCLLMMAFFVVNVFAQNVGIGTNTPNASALLELQSANKGLLLPRVADTNAVTTPAKGLLIFSNASNSTWFYDGTKWQGATTDGLWTTFQDSIAISQKKHVGINTDYKLYPAKKGIQANGSLLIHQEMTSTNAAPTVAQTHTMDNLPTVYSVEDSILRVLDPGGSNVPYFNNSQGNASLYTNTGVGFEISFNGSDFGIATGDTLWISTTTFPNCRTNYIRRYLNTTLVPENFNVNNNQVFVVFRSNGDNINNKGFDITCKTIYKKSSTEYAITSIGNALYFNGNIGSLGVGSNVTASGINSFAMGSNSKANGYGSIAMGNDANASGYIAISLGDRTISSGQTSTSIGFQTKALDFASMAFGASTTASGSTSTAMGLASTASGVASTAMGYNTNAIGDNSTAMGNSTTASGANSTVMGVASTASGIGSTAMGSFTTASSFYSTAMGNGTTASGATST
ncbi:MAG: hypothetical protein ACOYKE_04440, partial [Ferruginibacter sp.]